MEWELQYSDQIEWFETLAEQGKTVPALESRPQLYNDLIMDYQAFNMLSSSRRSGMGVGPIPLSEIKAFIELYEIDDWHQRQQFITRIKILDNTYLKWHVEKNKKNG